MGFTSMMPRVAAAFTVGGTNAVMRTSGTDQERYPDDSEWLRGVPQSGDALDPSPALHELRARWVL